LVKDTKVLWYSSSLWLRSGRVLAGINANKSNKRKENVKCYVDGVAHAAEDAAAGAGNVSKKTRQSD
jgi:hypothetical protein